MSLPRFASTLLLFALVCQTSTALDAQAQTGATFFCNPAPEDPSTTRCVFTSSALPLDLAALLDLNGYSSVDPNDLLVTVEAYGASGESGNSGSQGSAGAGGIQGYASTTWSGNVPDPVELTH
jgi:hypothetical protein